ncbi:MAG: tetraacyldisaccharide 4'-kinase [Legionella sp.]
MSAFLESLWYGRHPLQSWLRPFSWFYRLMVSSRKAFLQAFCQRTYPIPIIVVGNLTVGGVGKTPLVIALAKQFQEKGLKVGIVSRGYGAAMKQFPYEIQVSDQAGLVGDEPLLLAQKTLCPVVIAPKRTQAVDYLLEHHKVQIIISDDGLQHYRMGRAIELLVIDGTRGLGNGFCLPAGPLRESPKRLRETDFLIVNEGTWDNAYSMTLKPGRISNVMSNKEIASNELPDKVAAVAAIGNPQRFYNTLKQLGIECTTYSYPDHYQFTADDLHYAEAIIIMTEKDAVKCRLFNNADQLYYLPVEAVLNDAFWDALWSHQRLQGLI